MSLDADFKRHLGELAAEVSEGLRRELEEHKRQLLWNARQTHNSAALPIAYSETSIYAFRTRVEKTIAKFLEALESCDIVVDGVVETEMLEIIRPLTVGVPRLMFPPGLDSPNLSAVQSEHARELIRVGSSLYRKAANRLREARIKATRTMPIIQEKAVLKSADDDVPTVLVSYSWDSTEHKEWVLRLSEELTVKGGTRVILDQWDLRPGGDRTLFMERSVVDSDFVLVICSPNYASKANQRSGGVGYEAMIITSQLARSVEQEKFIPVLRSGDWASSSPVWLQSKIGVDLSGNPYDQTEYEKLVRTLHDEHVNPPVVGPKPRFQERSGHAEASTATAALAIESANAAPDLERMPRPYLEVLDDTATAFGRTAFVFTNRGGDVAHNVQVQPLSINHCTVTFDPISTIAVNEEKRTLPTISGIGIMQQHDILNLMVGEWDAVSARQSDEIPDEWVTKLTVTYTDFRDTKYEVMLELVVFPIQRIRRNRHATDWPKREYKTVEVRNIKFRQVNSMPAAQTYH